MFKLLCNEEIKHENKKEKAVLFFKVGLVRIREGSELGSLPYSLYLLNKSGESVR